MSNPKGRLTRYDDYHTAEKKKFFLFDRNKDETKNGSRVAFSKTRRSELFISPVTNRE